MLSLAGHSVRGAMEVVRARCEARGGRRARVVVLHSEGGVGEFRRHVADDSAEDDGPHGGDGLQLCWKGRGARGEGRRACLSLGASLFYRPRKAGKLSVGQEQ